MQFGKVAQLTEVLSSLVEKAFILPVVGTDEDVYLFRHVLTSDAVYRTLLRRDRNTLHGSVARALEQLFADRLESQVEVLAGHYLRSEYLDKALHYLILAGQKSARGYANLQAKTYFEEARDLLSQVAHTPEQALQVWNGLGDVQVFIGEYEQARECYLEALSENKSTTAGQSMSVIHRKIAITHERQGDFDQSLAHLDLASKELREANDTSPVARAHILNDTGWIYFLRGNFDQAQGTLLSALELVENSDNYSVVASIYNRLGAVAYQLREYKQAAKYVRNSLELRKTLGDISGEARLYNNLGLLGLMSGDLHEAENNFDRSIELLENVGDTEGIALANINLGLVKYDLGDYGSAEIHLEKAQAVAEKIGHRFYIGLANMYQGRLKSALGGYKLAVRLLNESMQIFEELGAQDNLIDAMCYLAENYLSGREISEAIQWSEKAHLALGENLADDSVQAGRVYRVQGAIARYQGDLVQAASLLLESAEIFRAAYEKLESARTAYELGLLALEISDSDGAQEYFDEARNIFTEVGAEKELQRVEGAMDKIAV
jgi:tetratricopeptide (TPR) repeat protein